MLFEVVGFTTGSTWICFADDERGEGRAVDDDVEATEDGAGGSVAFSTGPECKPTGFKGSLSVPLFGAGVMPTESHRML